MSINLLKTVPSDNKYSQLSDFESGHPYFSFESQYYQDNTAITTNSQDNDCGK